MGCQVCKKDRPDGHACAHVDCPVRKPGASMRELGDLPPWAGRHDGLGWDRFYKGQRKPTAPKDHGK